MRTPLRARLQALVVLCLLAAPACKHLPKVPQTLDEWLALAREGKDLGMVAEELARRKAQCEAIGKEPIAWEEERAIGSAIATRWIQQMGGLVIDVPAGKSTAELAQLEASQLTDGEPKRLELALNVIGRSLAIRSERPALPWTFALLDSPGVNAYAAPGGTVLVTSGLLAEVENESQLAGVLAHEIVHVTGRHAMNEYRKKKSEACSRAFLQALSDTSGLGPSARAAVEQSARSFDALLKKNSGGFIDLDDKTNLGSIVVLGDGLGDQISSDAYSKEDELEADRQAAGLLVAAGYAPKEYSKLLAGLPSGSGPLAKHPPGPERAKAVDAFLATLSPKDNPLGYADWPFDARAAVPLPPELAKRSKAAKR